MTAPTFFEGRIVGASIVRLILTALMKKYISYD